MVIHAFMFPKKKISDLFEKNYPFRFQFCFYLRWVLKSFSFWAKTKGDLKKKKQISCFKITINIIMCVRNYTYNYTKNYKNSKIILFFPSLEVTIFKVLHLCFDQNWAWYIFATHIAYFYWDMCDLKKFLNFCNCFSFASKNFLDVARIFL